MQTTQHAVLLTKEDHDDILQYLRKGNVQTPDDRESATHLQEELKRACLVNKEQLPVNVIRLGSRVNVRELVSGKQFGLVIVTPDKSDRKEKKISVLSPVGTALIGCCSGATIKWKVPAGERSFLIEDVQN